MSGASSRARGRRGQTAVRQHLAAAGLTVIEPGGAGAEATDLVILGTPVVSVEVKWQARLDLAGWHRQAVDQAPGDAIPVVAHRRHGVADVGQTWVTLSLDDLVRLLG